MKLEELKNNIKENKLTDDLIIFVCPENTFLANEYTDAIVKFRGGNRKVIKSIFDTQTATAFFMDLNKPIYILRIDKFAERAEDYSNFTNTIVICEAIDKTVKTTARQYVVEMPKREDWQIIDYIKAVCPKIKNEAEWLYTACNKDIFKIKNELDKINLFQDPKEALTEMKNLPVSDLFEDAIFKFTDALLVKDFVTARDFMIHRQFCDLEPVAIVNTLLINLTKIIAVCFSNSLEQSKLNLTSAQYWAIKYRYKNFPLGRAMYCLDEMSTVDMKLKTGKLDLDKDSLLSFIVTRMFS